MARPRRHRLKESSITHLSFLPGFDINFLRKNISSPIGWKDHGLPFPNFHPSPGFFNPSRRGAPERIQTLDVGFLAIAGAKRLGFTS